MWLAFYKWVISYVAVCYNFGFLRLSFRCSFAGLERENISFKGKPNENCVLAKDITLEDAYIYLTNS